MSAQFARPASFEEEQQYLHAQELKNKRFALQLWRLVNGMIFVFFAFANYLMRSAEGSWPPQGVSRLDATLPAIFSAILLLSALPATRVQAAIGRNDRTAMLRNILATLALGVVFLIGLALIWRQVPYSGAYSTIFFTMTGFHAVHVGVGMILFAYVFLKAQKGAYSPENHWSVEATVVFWHFVELMWIFYFVVLYIA
jgi:cytochrome c oxidase subunit III